MYSSLDDLKTGKINTFKIEISFYDYRNILFRRYYFLFLSLNNEGLLQDVISIYLLFFLFYKSSYIMR